MSSQAPPNIPVYHWKQLDLNAYTEKSCQCMMTIKFWSVRAHSLGAFFSFATDAFLGGQLISDPATKDNIGTAYGIFFCLDILWSICLYYNSKEVVDADVISETYINEGAFHYMSLQSYNHFCFLQDVTEKQTLGDKMIIGMFIGIRQWFQLFVIDLPRMVIALIRLFSKSAPRNDTTTAAVFVRLFSLWLSIWLLMIIVCVYPCLNLCLASEPIDEVASRRINERIHEIVLEKNLLASASPTSGGVAASQIEVEMQSHAQLQMMMSPVPQSGAPVMMMIAAHPSSHPPPGAVMMMPPGQQQQMMMAPGQQQMMMSMVQAPPRFAPQVPPQYLHQQPHAALPQLNGAPMPRTVNGGFNLSPPGPRKL